MQNTNRNTKYKMPCHVPQAQIKKEVLKDKLQIKNPKHKYDVRQTYQTKPAKPNLPNQIKLSLPSILNQTYQTKITGQSSQPLGPQCLWQCLYVMTAFQTLANLMISWYMPHVNTHGHCGKKCGKHLYDECRGGQDDDA